MTVGLSTGSTVTAFQNMKEAMVEKFGVSKDYAAFALPMGISFFAPGGVLLHLLVLLFISHLAGIPVSAGWMFSALLLNYIFAVASPPVSGGAIAVMTILLSTQGIGEEWYGIALVSLMILDYVTTTFRICMTVLVCACQAEELDLRE